MSMNDTELKDLTQVRDFVTSVQSVELHFTDQRTCYAWIAKTLKRFDYFKRSKKDKGTVVQYLLRMTGYTRQHLTKLTKEYKKHRCIGVGKKGRHTFTKRYTRKDIRLLAKTDQYHHVLSGGATKKLLERAYTVYHDNAYERLSQISISHLYNLRKTISYRQSHQHFEKTHPTKNNIGKRRKPRPEGKPGYLRVDTVHQGDQDGEKGIYHINAVDEVTQMEIICSVEKISEQFMLPVFEQQIEGFPFEIKGYHVDNGTEFINRVVAKLLNKLLIELTKSRARHSNDNALAESKNGSVVRKHLGYCHIPQYYAERVNTFYREYFNNYINFHRPCYYPVIVTDKRGKEVKKYPYENMMTPYEKFKSLPNASHFLKPGMSFNALDKVALAIPDLEAAENMQQEKQKMFREIFKGRIKNETSDA